MAEEKFESLVHEGDVLAACRAVLPDVRNVLTIQAQPATSSSQGFMSLMLRVTARVRHNNLTTSEVKLIVKRKPTMVKQLEHIEQSFAFEREVAYYRDVVPILQQRCSRLPLANCWVSYGSTFIMQDLCHSGYQSLTRDFRDIGLPDLVTLPHVKLIVRSLARLHVASLGTDWTSVLPELYDTDPMLHGSISRVFDNMVPSGCRTTSIAMKELLPDKTKHAEWLLGPGCYNEMKRLCKPNADVLNVLCHGDCHVNNMMFQHVNGKPVDVKILDMQLFRYSPPSRDILYLLYASVSREFRLRHEAEILRTYVEAFNAAACKTPDLLPLDEFLAEYEASRMFGLGMACLFRPLLFRESALPPTGEGFTEDKYQAVLFQDPSDDTLEQMRNNTRFREAVSELVDEAISCIDRAKLV